METHDIVTINGAFKRSKAENIPVSETALRRWVKDGTLHATYAGRKALIYWPNVVKLLCGESAEDRDTTNCTIEAQIHSANRRFLKRKLAQEDVSL